MTASSPVLVFGVFDRLHDGHRFFLTEAKRLGDSLIVVLALDETVKNLKGHRPEESLKVRTEALKASGLADTVVAGDAVLRTWTAIKKCKPTVIALGYDQVALQKELEGFTKDLVNPPRIEMIGSHEGGKFHSSSLRP